jgi:hypothetical protein
MAELQFWRDALAGDDVAIHESEPQPGWYKMRERDGRWVPVAILADDTGALSAQKGGRLVDPFEVWTWCCRQPIDHDLYIGVTERGEPWPDDIPGIGHNGLGFDPLIEIADDIAFLREAAQSWLERTGVIGTQADADKAANYAQRFAMLAERAEAERVAAKRPALEEGRAVDQRWKPLIAAAEAAKIHLKQALTPYLVARADQQDGRAEPPRAGTGPRRIGLRTTRQLSVIDWTVLVEAYRNDERIWRQNEIRAALVKIAEADALAGRDMPGAILVEHRVAA